MMAIAEVVNGRRPALKIPDWQLYIISDGVIYPSFSYPHSHYYYFHIISGKIHICNLS